MRRHAPLSLFTTLTLFLTACPRTVTPPPPNSTTFPVSEISGTIPNWTAGEAYVTLASGYSETSTEEGEEIVITPPAYQTTLSAAGAFAVPLAEPAASELLPLTCGAEIYPLGFLFLAAVSSTPQPAASAEVLGIYTLGPPDNVAQDAVWLYREEVLELDATCTLLGGPMAVKVNLETGWNQTVLTLGQPARLESAPVPETFVWSQF